MPQFFVLGIIAIVLIISLIFVILLRSIDKSRRKPPVIFDLITKEGQSLVVLVHGTRRRTAYLDGMRMILDEVRPEADVLFNIRPETSPMRTPSLSRSRSVTKFTSSTVRRSTVRLFWWDIARAPCSLERRSSMATVGSKISKRSVEKRVLRWPG